MVTKWLSVPLTVIQDVDDMTVRMHVSAEMKEEVFKRVLDFYKKHESWSGESVMQRDAPQIDAAPFLADLVDEVLKPVVEYR